MSVKKWQLQPFNGCARVPECLPTGSLAYGPTGMRACLRAQVSRCCLPPGSTAGLQHGSLRATECLPTGSSWPTGREPTGFAMPTGGMAYGPI